MSYQSTILADNPVGFWPLNETSGTTATDLGSGGNNGTYAGSPTLGKTGLVFEAGGKCPDFDGADDRVSFLTSGLSLSGSITLECWFRQDAIPPAGKVGVLISIEGSTGYVRLETDDAGNLKAYVNDGANNNATTAISNGVVYHAVAVYNPAGANSGIKLCLDAVEEAYVSCNNATTSSVASDYIGARNVGTGFDYEFNGKIAYAAVYGTALTPLQIRRHYQAGIAQGFHKEILDLSPDLYLPLNEASGDALDWSGNDGGGTPAGDITQGATGLLAYDTATGYQFGGTNGEITISHPASTTTYSLFAALSIDSATGEYKILEDGGVGHWSIKDGKQNLNYSASDHLGTATLGTATLVAVGVTVNAGAVTFYTNGVSDGTASSATALDFETLSDAAASFDGILHCVTRYPTALTAANHRTLAMAARTLIESRGYPKVISNLTPSFYARLGEASGTTVFDESGNGNDGTINGSPVMATAEGPLHQSALKAMTFDGVDDYVQTTYAGQTGSTARTLLAWVKPSSLAAVNPVASYGTNTAADMFQLMVETDGKIKLDINGADAKGSTVLAVGNWYLISAVLTGTDVNSIDLYVNGAVETEVYTSGATVLTTASSVNLRIGQDIGSTLFFAGDMGEVKEVASALTAQQIKQIYEAGRSRYAAEVISYQPRNMYRYNESSGNLIDYGALGNDGTWTGSPTYQQASPVISNESADRAIAVTAAEEVAITSDIAGTTYSFLFLGKPTAVSGTQDIFDDGGSDGFRLNGDKMSLFYSATEHDSDTALIAGEPHLFGVSVNAGAVTFNLDGGANGTATSAPLINPDTLFDSSFAGDADEAAIFNIALTDAQFLDIYEMASYSLAPPTYKITGTITESLGPVQWLVRAYNFDTGAHIADDIATGSYSIETEPYAGPVGIIAHPDMGSMWVASTAAALGDRVYPTNPVAKNRYFECTTSGTTGSTEPTWPTSGTVNDNGVVWTFVSDFVRPRVHGPLKPTLSS